MSAQRYGAGYHREQVATAASSAEVIVPLVLERFRPRSVVDVGCGLGLFLAEAVRHGVEDVLGVDGGDHDPGDLRIPADRFVAHDLEQPLELGRTFDLALCLEVAEHLPEAAADTLVASLAAAAPIVVFSAAVPHQGGVHHVNEQWPAFWAARFHEHGLTARDELRLRLWQDDRVAWWYAQNLLVYVRDDGPFVEPSALVHPRRYLEWVEWGIAADAARWEGDG